MKYLLFSIFLFVGCSSPKLYIPTSDVKLTNQQLNFFSGTTPLKIVINKAYMNPKTFKFTIYGYTDFTCAYLASRQNKTKFIHPKTPISLIRNGDTIPYGHAQRWGKFKIEMYNGDTVLFEGEQYKLMNIEYYCF
ncbi:MAG: hypothetical protein JNM21_14780 [Taibaiella sp.]|nr:hypothetical protein [Taibaiella sp.]